MQRGKIVRALVTGGAGFIGSHLVGHLVESGSGVRVLDDLSTGRRENLGDVEILQGDIRDAAAVRRALKDVDAVFHLAALASVPRSVEDPISTNDVNVNGTYTVLNEAARAGVRRLVFASSSSVYGESEALPKHEEMTPDPLSPYAASKLAGELACRAFSRSCGLETVSLRFFNVYGPRQDPDSPYAAVIPIFLKRLRSGEDLPIFGDGRQTRDFTYVGDVVRGIRDAATAEKADGEVLNLAGGHPITLLDLAESLGKAAGQKPELRFEPIRSGDILHSYGDPTRARSLLEFETRIDIEEGLKRTAADFE